MLPDRVCRGRFQALPEKASEMQRFEAAWQKAEQPRPCRRHCRGSGLTPLQTCMGDLFDMEASTPQKRSKRVALVLSLSSLIIASMLHHFPQLTELSVAAVGGGGYETRYCQTNQPGSLNPDSTHSKKCHDKEWTFLSLRLRKGQRHQ